eukprot:CAMPEP_0181520086 /NCGR_PEP_ID=MMETSP1110-20121109/66123_1 /TAXON_ID=174948 /ORGANISM="Symbiodinium sp., Strain CCMP421" /LENGTH=38 /DNA_ID= /DNA_START= /DNA_END= /DNA_ORIENTATION=
MKNLRADASFAHAKFKLLRDPLVESAFIMEHRGRTQAG